MKNYPPILKPAMELIEAQAKTISELISAIDSLTERINRLSADMGYHPISSIKQSTPFEPPMMEMNTNSSPAGQVQVSEETLIKSNTNTETYYCHNAEIAGEGLAFYCDTLQTIQGESSFFKLEVDSSSRKGTFSIVSENSNQYGCLTEIKEACECDSWMENLSFDLANVAPGTVVLDDEDGDEKWKITKKAVIKFEPNTHE